MRKRHKPAIREAANLKQSMDFFHGTAIFLCKEDTEQVLYVRAKIFKDKITIEVPNEADCNQVLSADFYSRFDTLKSTTGVQAGEKKGNRFYGRSESLKSMEEMHNRYMSSISSVESGEQISLYTITVTSDMYTSVLKDLGVK